MTWTPELKDQVADMLHEGLSASQIAARIGDVTRNAVIGVVNRDKRLKEIGFKRAKSENDGTVTARAKRISAASNRKKNVRGGTVSRNRLKIVPTPPIVEIFEAIPDVPGRFGAPHVAGVDLMMLTEHRCKWPINDGGPFLFCGEAKKSDRPYCAFHAQASIGKGTESERTAVRSAMRMAA